ncbi:MAG: type II toxin-antitoxin system RelE/ParE family toxin [Gemmatimonadota bacterium]|nr:type II toxin-antitoxin system RelE/ParE family toxin [Gemmatimonadota bacterium]
MTTEWTARARKDLSDTYSFIARDSESRAKDFCDLLVVGCSHLAKFPFSGALVPEDGAYRQIVVSGYRVVYTITEAGVRIMTVVGPGRGLPGL